ncbi:MAG: hypothetical protein ISS16_09535 [Ignavibacteria bacterium]|nr:hypothetical protein [Ignavibacteria bacterium]
MTVHRASLPAKKNYTDAEELLQLVTKPCFVMIIKATKLCFVIGEEKICDKINNFKPFNETVNFKIEKVKE